MWDCTQLWLPLFFLQWMSGLAEATKISNGTVTMGCHLLSSLEGLHKDFLRSRGGPSNPDQSLQCRIVSPGNLPFGRDVVYSGLSIST